MGGTWSGRSEGGWGIDEGGRHKHYSERPSKAERERSAQRAHRVNSPGAFGPVQSEIDSAAGFDEIDRQR
jgi:hypothetical protein